MAEQLKALILMLKVALVLVIQQNVHMLRVIPVLLEKIIPMLRAIIPRLAVIIRDLVVTQKDIVLM